MQTRGKKPATRPKAKPVKQRPADDFATVARRLGADEDKGRFEAKLGKVATATPERAGRFVVDSLEGVKFFDKEGKPLTAERLAERRKARLAAERGK